MRKRVEAILASLLILLCVGMRFAYIGHGKSQEGGVDLITIDALIPFGKLERPAARFPHERHVAGVADGNCQVCHESRPGEDSGILYTFKGQDGLSREGIKDLYHTECITCHADREAAKQPTGPQVCSGCHLNGGANQIPPSHSIDFNTNLHAVHADTSSLDCQLCHDVLGGDKPKEYRNDLLAARPGDSSHDLCITCHLEGASVGTASGPLDCTGCHQSRSYPSDTIAHGGEVDFDHELHEMGDVSCEVCHHKEPETSCKECHAEGDSGRGGGVTLQMAMHSKQAGRSCVGCHDAMDVGTVSDCSSCHVPFGSGHE